VRKEGNIAQAPRPLSTPVTPALDVHRFEDVSGRSNMGPPLEKPAKPDSSGAQVAETPASLPTSGEDITEGMYALTIEESFL
jgi:hypothetical protein